MGNYLGRAKEESASIQSKARPFRFAVILSHPLNSLNVIAD
jgi:hypothetical protein